MLSFPVAGQNIGHLVPAAIIEHFLHCAAKGLPNAFPDLGIAIQRLESPALRRSLHMPAKETGIRVTAVGYGSSAHGVLQVDDVVLSLGGYKISNNGTVRYRDVIRTSYTIVLQDFYVNQTVECQVRRAGELVSLSMVLRPRAPLIARWQYDVPVFFVLYGGCVFQALSRNYLDTWDDWHKSAPSAYVFFYYNGVASQSRRELVCLTDVLADEINVGMSDCEHDIIETVNGTAVVDLAHFATLLDAAQTSVRIVTHKARVLFFDIAEERARMQLIRERYQVTLTRRVRGESSAAAAASSAV